MSVKDDNLSLQSTHKHVFRVASTIAPTLDDVAVEAASDPLFDRQHTAANMLYALYAFAYRLKQFFDTGFSENGAYQLEDSDCEPPAYIYCLIASQVSYDLDGIIRAYSQRRIINEAPSRDSQKKAKDALYFADRLGYQILRPAMEAGMIPQSTILTYFQKSLRIRLIPYGRVAVVGFPYSAIENSVDYLALAHELGHFIYRYTKFQQEDTIIARIVERTTPSEEEKQKKIHWYDDWYEEIFADVFGTIFAGPKLALSFQTLSEQVHSKWFNTNSGEHPTAILRPYVYTYTLRELGKIWNINLDKVIQYLEDRWAGKLRDETKVLLPGHDCPMPLAKAAKKIHEDIIVPLLNKDPDSNKSDSLSKLVKLVGPNSDYDNSLFRIWWDSVQQWNDLFAPGSVVPEKQIEDLDLEAYVVPELVAVEKDAVSNQAILTDEYQKFYTQLKVDAGGEIPYALKIEPHEKFDSIAVVQRRITGGSVDGGDERLIKLLQEGLGDTLENFGSVLNQTLDAPNNKIPREAWLEVLSFGGWIDKGPNGPHGHK